MVSFQAISSQFNAVEREKKTFWKKKLKAYIVPYYITTTQRNAITITNSPLANQKPSTVFISCDIESLTVYGF